VKEESKSKTGRGEEGVSYRKKGWSGIEMELSQFMGIRGLVGLQRKSECKQKEEKESKRWEI